MPPMFMTHHAQMAQPQRPPYSNIPTTPQGPLAYGYMINTPVPQIAGHPQYR